MEDIPLALAAIAAVAAIFAACQAKRSADAAREAVKETRRIFQASVYYEFVKEYSSPGMLRDLDLLADYKGKINNNEITHERCVRFRKIPPSYEYKINKARRPIKYHFFNAFRLYKKGIISEELLKDIGNVDGINLLYNVCKPLEEAIGKEMEVPDDTAWFDELEEICPPIEPVDH